MARLGEYIRQIIVRWGVGNSLRVRADTSHVVLSAEKRANAISAVEKL